ncbi:hypothetical protein C2E23DRAFT_539520 [Lenzites betulinus]|nr:hypothetical protein C2E23DRAFT_539520 [Lenzites betulinus]
MASPLYWPGRYYFYPIGNTPAVSLTRDLPPDVPANILLLPCGDARNVLYTVFCESPSITRKLDFTCGDYDPGVLARNALLYTMIIDNVAETMIWNIFFHLYFDDNAHAALLSQCDKLLACSATPEDWHASPYGAFLRVGTEETLLAFRRLWSLYAELSSPAGRSRASAARKMVDTGREEVIKHNGDFSFMFSSARSAGPLLLDAVPVATEHFSHYWRTGSTAPENDLPSPKTRHANPTFLCSRRGEGFYVHYGTDPLAGFHLAPLYGNRTSAPSVQQAVAAAQAEFREWCQAFLARTKSSPGSLLIRFILGDALHIASVLSTWSVRDVAPPIAPWTSKPLVLHVKEYRDRRAPTLFDVVDTSNLSDHVGLLNILISTIPLLATSDPWRGILYTEFLLAHRSDPATQFLSLLLTDISTATILLGVCPVDALSGFTTACHLNEVILDAFNTKSTPQHHQIITWKRPHSSDPHVEALRRMVQAPSLQLDSQQLASLLCDAYHRLFGAEDPTNFWKIQKAGDREKAVADSAISRHSRETFALFLRLAHMRLPLSDAQWNETMRLLLDEIVTSGAPSGSHPFDNLYHQDLAVQFYRHHVYTIPTYVAPPRAAPGRLSQWTSIPPLVRIYLVVPQERFAVLRAKAEAQTPPLHCVVSATGPCAFECAFQSVSSTFGTIINTGSPASPSVVIQEADAAFDTDTSPLIVSFVVHTWMLTDVVPDPGKISVGFHVKSTLTTTKTYASVLGIMLAIFSTSLSDTQHVHIVPEARPAVLARASSSTETPTSIRAAGASSSIGTHTFVHVDLDGKTNSVASLTARLLVEDTDAKATFAQGALPVVTQPSPFSMRVALGGRVQDLVYPLPVVGAQQKVRLARKSSYIEVVVPVAMPYPKAWALKSTPFPVIRTDNTLFPWNMHRVPLDRSPALDVTTLTSPARQWFNPHISLQMSDRERKMRTAKSLSGLALVKDTIHSIMVRFAGIQGGPRSRVFALRDEASGGKMDTMFFVSELRYDLACHTVVCDAFVLCLTPQLAYAAGPALRAVMEKPVEVVRVYGDEMRTWKHLLPALVERCRAAWKHGRNCEYAAQGRIPLEVDIEAGDPLCSCGRGKDVKGMHEVPLWKKLAPFVTRVALSPLFPVPYLEPILDRDEVRDAAEQVRAATHDGKPEDSAGGATRCARCSKSGDALRRCARCKAVAYCSQGCQKSDWKKHKPACVATE